MVICTSFKYRFTWQNSQIPRKKNGRRHYTCAKISHRPKSPNASEYHASQEHKAGITLTRQEQVNNLYRQVAEINRNIASRPDGQRFPSSKEADILGKLSAAISKMEQETGIADKISVLSDFINWLRELDTEQARAITALADSYIKSQL